MKTKLIVFLITNILCAYCFGQIYKLAFGDTIDRLDKKGTKQKFWIEKDGEFFFAGNYINGQKDGSWGKYDFVGTWKDGYLYKNGKYISKTLFVVNPSKRTQRAIANSRYIPPEEYNNVGDSCLYIRFYIQNRSIYSRAANNNISDYIDSVRLEVIEIDSKNENLDYETIRKNTNTYYTSQQSQFEYIKPFKDTTRKVKKIYIPCVLKPNKEYLISFSKENFLTKKIIINTRINLEQGFKLFLSRQYVNLSNRVIDLYDPIIVNYPSNKFFISEFGNLKEDYSFKAFGKIILERKSDFDMKSKVVELENSVNQQIINLKEKQLALENERKLKEEELKRIESDNMRKALELDLLEKEKSLSAIALRAKETELIKNQLLANEKKREIESLNQQKLINELNLKNKESELAQKNIEAETRQKQIKGLEHEKALSDENLKQQQFIRNLVLAGAGLLVIFLGFVFVSLSKSRKANKIIASQKTEVEKQKHLVEEKQKEIVDSISYAKRLQEAILPPKEFVNTHLTNNFIYYQPKDIVAGDFYWAEKVGDKFFIAAADSTGHGVPGAMVSVVCSNALNRTIKEFKLTETGKILDKTRELVLETFEKSASEVKDGMDISLLCIDSKNRNIFWSGANNPLWYIQNNELLEIKADKQPIGKTDYPKPFTTHQLEYRENTTFYLFTDGLADQFGGPNGKKFKYKQFSDLLLKSNSLSQNQQADIINKAFSDWKGDLEQVDDVCVIGIKI